MNGSSAIGARCCPFLQTFLGGCVDKCGSEKVRSDRGRFGYNETTGFPLGAPAQTLSSYRAGAGALCLVRTPDAGATLESRAYIDFELELWAPNLAKSRLLHGSRATTTTNGTTIVPSRANLRESVQDLFNEHLWLRTWPLMHLSGTVIRPVEREIVVSDVFLRTGNHTNSFVLENGTSLVVRWSMGAFESTAKAATFQNAVEAAPLSQRLQQVFGNGSWSVMLPDHAGGSAGHHDHSGGDSPVEVSVSQTKNLRIFGIRTISRLPPRPCPGGQRPSKMRELTNLTVSYPVFGAAVSPGCEDLDECNEAVNTTTQVNATTLNDTQEKAALLLRSTYPLAERAHVRNVSFRPWPAENVCDRRPTSSFPADFGTNPNSSVQPHVCENLVGNYSCECAPGYRYEFSPRSFWNMFERSEVHGNYSCVEIDECQEHLVSCGSSSAEVRGSCVDLVNDYRCECNVGYELVYEQFPMAASWPFGDRPHDPQWQRQTCQDINECDLGVGGTERNPWHWPSPCGSGWHKQHTCTDGPASSGGGYSCQCTYGFDLVSHSAQNSEGLPVAARQPLEGKPYLCVFGCLTLCHVGTRKTVRIDSVCLGREG